MAITERRRRCPYCDTTYRLPHGATIIDEFRTADPYPPAVVAISVGGVVIHKCENGKPQS